MQADVTPILFEWESRSCRASSLRRRRRAKCALLLLLFLEEEEGGVVVNVADDTAGSSNLRFVILISFFFFLSPHLRSFSPTAQSNNGQCDYDDLHNEEQQQLGVQGK